MFDMRFLIVGVSVDYLTCIDLQSLNSYLKNSNFILDLFCLQLGLVIFKESQTDENIFHLTGLIMYWIVFQSVVS